MPSVLSPALDESWSTVCVTLSSSPKWPSSFSRRFPWRVPSATLTHNAVGTLLRSLFDEDDELRRMVAATVVVAAPRVGASRVGGDEETAGNTVLDREDSVSMQRTPVRVARTAAGNAMGVAARHRAVVVPPAAADATLFSELIAQHADAFESNEDAEAVSRIDSIVLTHWVDLQRMEGISDDQQFQRHGSSAQQQASSLGRFSLGKAAECALNAQWDAMSMLRSVSSKRPRDDGDCLSASTPQRKQQLPKLLDATELKPHTAVAESSVVQAPLLATPTPRRGPSVFVADLTMLNTLLTQSQGSASCPRIAPEHVPSGLLCPACNLMPVAPVILECCSATLCRACAEPMRDVGITTKTSCVVCGEERELVNGIKPNPSREADVVRWTKEVSVLYRDVIHESSQAVLEWAPTALQASSSPTVSLAESRHLSVLQLPHHMSPQPAAAVFSTVPYPPPQAGMGMMPIFAGSPHLRGDPTSPGVSY